MTLRQTIQSAPAKANELIDKLSNTSNQAIKTRETLFRELSDQLTLYVEIEEQHLLPLLRQNPETKALATETLKLNKELRAVVSQLEATPKDDDSFLVRLAELKKNFQRHVRDERMELLPAVLKALSDDEAAELAESIEGGFADAENAKREAKREEGRQARQQDDAADRIAETQREAARAQRAAAREATEAAGRVADSVKIGAAKVQEGVNRVRAGIADKAQQAVSATSDALGAYQDSMRSTVQDLATVAASSRVSAEAISEVRAVVLDWAGKSVHTGVDASQQLLSCRTPTQFVEMQTAFATNVTRNFMEASTQMLEIAQRASRKALRPLETRLNSNA